MKAGNQQNKTKRVGTKYKVQKTGKQTEGSTERKAAQKGLGMTRSGQTITQHDPLDPTTI